MNKLSNVVIGNNGLDIYTADEHFTPICTCESKAYASEIKHAINNGTKLQQEHDIEIIAFAVWLGRNYVYNYKDMWISKQEIDKLGSKLLTTFECLDLFRKGQIPQL